jgi:hypothetical protein
MWRLALLSAGDPRDLTGEEESAETIDHSH